MTTATLDVIDPATEDVISTVADATVDDARAAVDRAAAAFPSWAAPPPRQRQAHRRG
jgi:succinate-semialdehyde dehydrogenase/glutarate-semialdehyde dehydrogenase